MSLELLGVSLSLSLSRSLSVSLGLSRSLGAVSTPKSIVSKIIKEEEEKERLRETQEGSDRRRCDRFSAPRRHPPEPGRRADTNKSPANDVITKTRQPRQKYRRRHRRRRFATTKTNRPTARPSKEPYRRSTHVPWPITLALQSAIGSTQVPTILARCVSPCVVASVELVRPPNRRRCKRVGATANEGEQLSGRCRPKYRPLVPARNKK